MGLQHDEEYEISKKLEYKLISGEEKGKLKYKKISESKSDTSVFTSSKSPLKMVFKKTSSTITVSPSVTPEPMPSIATKNLRKESVSNEPEKPVEAFSSPSQNVVQPKGELLTSKPSSSSPALNNLSLAKKTLPELMRRESREWKPSAQFFKPLLAG